ncbi:MAG: hemerythrin domain-containing protein [Magnetococcales bacterium]|nr:hemerythrin domain-containing protein [Magnetococcales bacterium]
MPRFDWQYGYQTNNKIIDLQHKYFLELMNRLHDELSANADPVYQERLLNELIAYAKFHFLSEENILLKHLPRRFAHQQRLHEVLLGDLQSKIAGMKTGQTTATEIVLFVVEWFFTHTITEDVTDFLPLS